MAAYVELQEAEVQGEAVLEGSFRLSIRTEDRGWPFVTSRQPGPVELIFDQGPGDLFVTRVAGNIADSASVASIEFAVAYLNVRIVVVLGHEDCGAVTAAIEGGDCGYHLNLLLAHILPAKEIMNGKNINSILI